MNKKILIPLLAASLGLWGYVGVKHYQNKQEDYKFASYGTTRQNFDSKSQCGVDVDMAVVQEKSRLRLVLSLDGDLDNISDIEKYVIVGGNRFSSKRYWREQAETKIEGDHALFAIKMGSSLMDRTQDMIPLPSYSTAGAVIKFKDGTTLERKVRGYNILWYNEK